MPERTVFVGGVHGVGKTYFCMKLTELFDVEHVTASGLIRKHVDLSKSKKVDNVEENQSVLVKELSLYRRKKTTLLLDGHFSLLNAASEFEDVPISTFIAISPYVIFMLKDNPTAIAKRISKRDEKPLEKELIVALQERETNRAKLVSKTLEVPIAIIEPFKSFDNSIKSVAPYL